MSKINGDKSRFHRIRKQRVQQRLRNRELYNVMTNGGPEPARASGKTGTSPALMNKSKVHSHD